MEKTCGNEALMNVREITACRLCGGGELLPLFSLGEQFVSDFVAREDAQSGIKAPLELVLCPRCTLVQLRHTVDLTSLYAKRYWYRSGQNATMRTALRDIAQAVENRVQLQPGDVVLDIGSNDGTLLRSYNRQDIVRVGVEPAENLWEEGTKGLDLLVRDFWSADNFRKVANCISLDEGQWRAKVITAIGMFYDLDDPNAFIADVAKVLAPDGLFVAQLMCLRNMVDSGDVGNICHEHLEFYSLESLDYLLTKHGLQVVGIEQNNVNGGSYRLYVRHESGFNPSARFHRMMEQEQDDGLTTQDFHSAFFRRLCANGHKCVEFIRKEVWKGKTIYGYGASTKGNAILQWYDLNDAVIPKIADRNPEKWGKVTVGSGIPICSEEEAREDNPDFFLVLPYAFRTEFLERERAWRDRGGKFVFPLPQFEVV